MKKIRDGRRALSAGIALLCLVCIGLIAPALFGSSERGPGSAAKVIAATRDVISVTAPVEISSEPRVVLESGTISHAHPRPTKGSLDGQSHIAISRGSIGIYLEGSSPVATAAPGQALAQILEAIAGLGFRSLTLRDTDVVLHLAGGTTETLEDVSAEIANSGEIAVLGALSVRGERLTIDLAFDRPSAAMTAVPLRANVTGNPLTARFTGSLSLADKWQLTAPNAELQIRNVRAAARWLGHQWPTGPGLGAFSAKGMLVLDARAATFEDARFSIDGNSATGALTLVLGGPRPAFQGTLAFETLSLAPYTAKTSSVLTRATGFLANLGLPGLTSPSLVREIDADVRLSANTVSAGESRLGGCAASINIKDGKLMGEIAELQLEQGGTGISSFNLDMTSYTPRMVFAANLDDVDLGKLSRLVGFQLVEGQGKLSVDLTADGATLQDLLGSATGKIALEMPEGGKVGVDMGALRTAAAASTAERSAGIFAASSTPVERLAARFTAASGVFTTEAFEATAGGREVTAQGAVDVPSRALDLTISVRQTGITTAPAMQPSREAWRVRGPWSSPAVSPVAQPGRSAEQPATSPTEAEAAKVPG